MSTTPIAERTELEKAALRAWGKWGNGYMLYTRCGECGELRLCRGKRRRWMLCLGCFDLGPEGEERPE